MHVMPIQLQNKNRLNKEYRSQHNNITPFFHYHPFHDFKKRTEELKARTYKRDDLSKLLYEMNLHWGATKETLDQIERLQQENSVVVIGGQQAGLLTGPLYSVNKVISILQLAKRQEKELGIPVIPVFWIAGEDHDFDEINHVFLCKENRLHKHKVSQRESFNRSITDVFLDKEKIRIWLKSLLNEMHETNHSKAWFEQTMDALHQSETYTDFFARLIFQLFPDQGLVLVDAHASSLRELESDYFTMMIEKRDVIQKGAYDTLQQLQHSGYEIPLDIEKDDTNLFYRNHSGERILLKDAGEYWIGKREEVKLTTAEMFDTARNNPERLSNNVITRPLMQELLFPTLAFIAGDGEINYWATLKKSFEAVDTKMPPVVPRLSFTYLSGRIQKLLNTRVLQVEQVIREGVDTAKINWLTSQSTVPMDILFDQAKQSIAQIHLPIQEYTATISADLKQEAAKNLQYIQKQMDYLQQRTIKKLEERYEIELYQFEEIQQTLHPRQGLQERVWNPFYFINDYGYSFLRNMAEEIQFSFEEEHYIVYM